MTLYRAKNTLTIGADYASTPEAALTYVTTEAAKVLGKCRLLTCEIKASEHTGNSWKVEATFEEVTP